MGPEVNLARNTRLDLGDAQWSFCAREHVPSRMVVPVDHASLWDWVDIDGPSDVLTLLKKSGKVADPYVGQNDLSCRWVENLDWAFRVLFQVERDFIQHENDVSLILQDLDCFTQVVLNGFHVGITANQFREYRFSVEELLIEGTNELIIYLRSQKRLAAALEEAHGQLPSGFDTSRVYARRCQCWTGWDWAARLSSAGVLSAPRLEIDFPLRLESPFIHVRDLPTVEAGQTSVPFVTLSVETDLVSQRKAKGVLNARIFDAEGNILAQTETTLKTPVGKSSARLALKLENPSLWWPVGFGDQPLYRLELEAEVTDRLGRTSTARCDCRIGVRSVSVQRSADAQGESFVPLVNGVPIFCRGTNWIPTRMLPGEASEGDYRLLIAAALAAGMNCLRIWGGGIYERDLFYDLCDEHGILVWQDFMFACAAYPVYKDFMDEVEHEADHQIKRLRNHPSLFLWCGNNENEWLHQIGELRLAREGKIIGEPIWSGLLKRKVEDLDPSRPYHQSSPFGKNRNDYNDENTGDRHQWECWARWQSPNVYLKDRGRFLSEFGFQSVPDLESVRQFAPAAESMDDPDLLHHQRMIQGQERLSRYTAELFQLPSAFEDWIEATQRLQAEILRRGVEHWRRRKFETAGTLIWQHHDSYPALSWALIDFYRRPKLAYLASKRFFSPILLSLNLLEDGAEVGAFPPPGRQRVEEEPPPDFPIGRDPASPAQPIVCSPPVRQIQVTLISDSPYPLSGAIKICSHSALDGGEISCFTSRIECAANSNSDPILINPGDLRLDDFSRTFVRGHFEPDEAVSEVVRKLTEETELRCSRVLEDADLPDEFRSAYGRCEFDRALSADLLLVEAKFLEWGDNVTIFGLDRPKWSRKVQDVEQV